MKLIVNNHYFIIQMLSNKINIRGLNSEIDNDLFYRYKMSKPIISNVKTFKSFDNIHQISTELKTDTKAIISFYKKKLGTQVIHKDNKMLVPNKILISDIIDNLYKYIEAHVLCPICKLPELFDSGEKCAACSYSKN